MMEETFEIRSWAIAMAVHCSIFMYFLDFSWACGGASYLAGFIKCD